MKLRGWASDALPKSKRRQVAVRGPRFRGKSMLAPTTLRLADDESI